MAPTSTSPVTLSDEVSHLSTVLGKTINLPERYFRDDLSPEYMVSTHLANRSEVRAKERGRLARLAYEDGRLVGFDVRSDTHHRSYRVRIISCTRLATYFGCNCPSGIHRPEQPEPCAHVGAVAASLVRRGLLRRDADTGLHLPTDKAFKLGIAARLAEPVDPFAGLPQ
jgi:hypothetical protein